MGLLWSQNEACQYHRREKKGRKQDMIEDGEGVPGVDPAQGLGFHSFSPAVPGVSAMSTAETACPHLSPPPAPAAAPSNTGTGRVPFTRSRLELWVLLPKENWFYSVVSLPIKLVQCYHCNVVEFGVRNRIDIWPCSNLAVCPFPSGITSWCTRHPRLCKDYLLYLWKHLAKCLVSVTLKCLLILKFWRGLNIYEPH